MLRQQLPMMSGISETKLQAPNQSIRAVRAFPSAELALLKRRRGTRATDTGGREFRVA